MTTPASTTTTVTPPAGTTTTPADDKNLITPSADGQSTPNQLPSEDGTKTEPPKSDVLVSFEPTGDPGLDMTLGFLGRLGFDLDKPSMQAAGKGDFSLLKAELAIMGDKATGWEQVLAVGEAAYKRKDDEFKAKAEADSKAMAEAAGGVEQWNKVKEWAGKNAEQAEREQINTALSQGGMIGQAMAAFLADQFSKATGITERGRSGLREDATSGLGANNAALSPEQYAQEINKLKSQYGSQFVNTTEYQEAQSRRRAWRG